MPKFLTENKGFIAEFLLQERIFYRYIGQFLALNGAFRGQKGAISAIKCRLNPQIVTQISMRKQRASISEKLY
jgi:hypothetical protein